MTSDVRVLEDDFNYFSMAKYQTPEGQVTMERVKCNDRDLQIFDRVYHDNFFPCQQRQIVMGGEIVEDNAKMITDPFQARSTCITPSDHTNSLVTTKSAIDYSRGSMPLELGHWQSRELGGESASARKKIKRAAQEPLESSSSCLKELLYTATALKNIQDDEVELSSCKPKPRNAARISKDPQSVAARQRRERISQKIRTLQRLVPGGTKMDTASMLDEAIHYVKFLKTQVHSLEMLGYAIAHPLHHLPL